MFKKTKIAAISAVVLGMSSMAAQAISVNDAGSEGQVLVFPYYNVNNDYVTAFNITNTTNETKAIKIRYRESENSNDVLDFNLYMSPFDVFTMTLDDGADGGVNLTTQDRSCTHPTIPADGVLFRHGAYDSTDVTDVREGYLEVIEMGVVTNSTVIFGVEHVAGLPRDCGVIAAAWQSGAFTQGGAASNTGAINIVNPVPTGFPVQNVPSAPGYYGQSRPAGLSAPTGGLVGTSIFVDSANISAYVAEPISIRNYSTVPQHYLSSDENFYLLPSLASGSVATSEQLGYDSAGNAFGVVQTYSAVVRDWGLDDKNVLPRTSVPSGINPLPIADAMLITNLANQYFLGSNTLTDWVISAPMRKHAIYNDYQYVASSTGYVPAEVDNLPEGEVAIGDIPVDGDLGDAAAPFGYWRWLDADDVNASFVYWDREESQTSVDPGDFSPPLVTPPTEIPFEREVNVLAFNASATLESVLGSDNALALTLAPGFDNGWGAFSFNGSYDLNGSRYTQWMSQTNSNLPAPGVPLFGFMAARSGNFGETFPHFYNKAR